MRAEVERADDERADNERADDERADDGRADDLADDGRQGEQEKADEQEEVLMGQDEQYDEAQMARGVCKPPVPTQKEVEAHERNGHLPFRALRSSCVAGISKENHHTRINNLQKQARFPLIQLDYMFLPGVRDLETITRVTAVEVAPLLLSSILRPHDNTELMISRLQSGETSQALHS
jgi:hypothetical protein